MYIINNLCHFIADMTIDEVEKNKYIQLKLVGETKSNKEAIKIVEKLIKIRLKSDQKLKQNMISDTECKLFYQY